MKAVETDPNSGVRVARDSSGISDTGACHAWSSLTFRSCNAARSSSPCSDESILSMASLSGGFSKALALAICKRLATYRCSQKLQRLARNRKLRHGATTATSISARQCCSSRTHSNSNMAYFQTFHRPSSSSSCTVYISGFLYHSVFVNALPCACVGGFLHQSWFEGQRSPQSLQG